MEPSTSIAIATSVLSAVVSLIPLHRQSGINVALEHLKADLTTRTEVRRLVAAEKVRTLIALHAHSFSDKETHPREDPRILDFEDVAEWQMELEFHARQCSPFLSEVASHTLGKYCEALSQCLSAHDVTVPQSTRALEEARLNLWNFIRRELETAEYGG